MDLPAAFINSRTQPTTFNPPPADHAKQHKEGNKKETQHKKVADNNLAERPEKADDDDDNDRHKSSTTTAKEKPKSTAKSKSDKTTEVNAEAVPVPAPDTGTTVSAIHPGILPVIPSQVPTTLTASPYVWNTGLASASSLTASTAPTLTGTAVFSDSPADTSRALSDDQASQVGGQSSKHLPVVLIVLVSIGLGFLLVGAFIVWRACRRPRRRSCPTPSLPILQDPFADQDLKIDEESLFGGKERASAVARPNSNGLWTWTQYTPKPSMQALGTNTGAFNYPVHESTQVSPSALLSEKAMPPPPPAPVHVPLPISNPPPAPPLQQMQSALTRAANRVSAMSMSIYPASPQSTSGIGLAIGGASPLTADGTPVLQRKPSANRLSKGRRSMRHSLAATEYLDVHADIYGGAQVTSPFVPTSPPPPPQLAIPIKSALRKSSSISVQGQGQGRARVKAPYNPGTGTALRSSSTVAGIATLARANRSSIMAPCEETQFVLPPLSPALKSDARRERDTRALTSAMGLATPDPNTFMPVSPQPTLYPDDSITLAGDRERRNAEEEDRAPARTKTHARVQSEAMSPGMEASARLGNLMLAEFTSMASLPSTRTVAHAPGTPAAGGGASGSKPRVARKNVRPDDRPPRVPSPPPLPSLAQMAMAHANPDEYADYRSPTYSIYGLYEAERKSRLPSEAGF
ncbi:hypothetical protein GY45DRAFT_1350239 [Cubamyces sp. BRFM 1775]|nr:hypothetical protein GY45DRAFT_1350239 [Cubamyces sp. BRFM 1775]